MRDIVVVFAGFVNESRFFVGMRRFYCCMSLSSMKKSPRHYSAAIFTPAMHLHKCHGGVTLSFSRSTSIIYRAILLPEMHRSAHC